ncbi:CoA-transferase [Microbacterium sp. zg.Y1090]|uniref:CoA-transferase subunit beta n=1 Tax=Microbacterium TaxID=33882 RepID=UPI00214CA3DA|nr:MULTISPECIES: CoA-transferase [unclassified Microbacterium]MCR2813336.1 CoA-transferase [Microbacterium sp. zg.Y1084]MCR2819830.1 CoA-transferase [Microbacterium sp. zg.Y1090]MDL5487941.1 CoA-transferase [Microbacterium sp. zg-Y1211]WIM28613.1 CoA-transferase [Microbacterium sp. zg-Y1090]
MTAPTTRAEVAATACSDLFRNSGTILASPIGVIPSIGARLARLTHAPDLLLSDGEAGLYADTPAVDEPFRELECLFPYRELFELIARGRRHVVMGAAQLDRHGNQNLSAIGDRDRPTRQLLGARAAATNTVNHATSYWVARHSTRVFVEQVDVVTGVGPARAAATGASRHQDLRRVVTNLAVLDLSGAGGTMALVSTHPGVTVDEVVAATGFALHLPADIPDTRLPTREERDLIRTRIDPRGLRYREVPA